MNTTAQRRSKERRETGTRQHLLTAARDCLRTRGVAHTSSRAIADAAGANLAAITYHYGSKDQLVTEALAAELREWLDPVLALLAEPGDPATRLLQATTVLTATFEDQRERVPGLLEVFVHAARDPDTGNPVTASWRDARSRLAAVIDELRSTGAVPPWVAPDAMAAVIVAVAAGTVVSVTVDPGGAAHREIASQFAALLLSASTAS